MVLSHYNKIEHLIENCHQHGTQNAYKIRQKLTKGQKMDHESQRMDTGNWKTDTGSWKMDLEAGKWRPEATKCEPGAEKGVRRHSGYRRPTTPTGLPAKPQEGAAPIY